MPVFISYSHNDAEIVNKMAAHLVKNNANVWVDTWELNVGDSILSKVQDAIEDSSALLIILSKSSVESEWCKKELNAGLMRELDEKKVIVLPVLVEDCEVPLFLREKMYADFRKNFDTGLKSILDAIAKISNPNQGRIQNENDPIIDWSVDWGFNDDLFWQHFTLVNHSDSLPFTMLTEIHLTCDDRITKRYQLFVKEGLDWIGRAVHLEALIEFSEQKDLKIIIDSHYPIKQTIEIKDQERDCGYMVEIAVRRLGEDNGKDQLININDYFKMIHKQTKETSRRPTQEEQMRLLKVISIPF